MKNIKLKHIGEKDFIYEKRVCPICAEIAGTLKSIVIIMEGHLKKEIILKWNYKKEID